MTAPRIWKHIFLGIITLCSLSVASTSFASRAKEDNHQWVVLTEGDDIGRKNYIRYLAISTLQGRRAFDPLLFDTRLDDFGNNFAYHGPIAHELMRLVKENDREDFSVLIPGAGLGNRVLDILAVADHVKIWVNDFQQKNIDTIVPSIERFGLTHKMGDRLVFAPGDILEQISTVADASQDVVYFANVIHFMTPRQIRFLFQEFHRVLKPNGTMLLLWQGFSPEKSYIDENLSCVYKRNQEKGAKYPGFFGIKQVRQVEPTTRAHHNYLSGKEAVDLAKGFFEIDPSQLYEHATQATGGGDESTGVFRVAQWTFEPYTEETSHCALNFSGFFTRSESPISHDLEIPLAYDPTDCCAHCGISSETGIRKLMECGQCHTEKYCSKECQRAGWATHKKSCKKAEAKSNAPKSDAPTIP